MTTEQRLVLTVSQLNAEVNHLFKQALTPLWIEGEISNLVRASSGHYYFSLKDNNAQLRCALFKGRPLHFKPENGHKVLALGSVGLYEPRGEYQFIVSQMEQAGAGQLQLQFEALKRKLNEEGLFAPEHKKPLPLIPKSIGVITSPTGAAIRDILNVLRRRCPQIPVVIYPVLVQGNWAAEQIVKAIAQANRKPQCEVLLLARGGGSMEDLWSFNEEVVARAIYQSTLPIVTGIGHEIDFTIADFVADRRAPTPSAAAELVSPETEAWAFTVQQWSTRLHRSVQRVLQDKTQVLQALAKRLEPQSPENQLQQKVQRLDELEQRLQLGVLRVLQHKQTQIHQLSTRLNTQSPVKQVLQLNSQVLQLQNQLERGLNQYLAQKQLQLQSLALQLQALSPLSTLGRGYAMVRNSEQVLVKSTQQVSKGDVVNIQLQDGSIHCEVLGKSS